jgi:drug/metabolite transporter (DMT)-like permease
MENSKPILKGLLALALGAALLGLSAIFVRYSEVSPSLTAFYRAFLALPFLYIWILIERKSIGINLIIQPKVAGLFALSGLFFALDMSIWNWSISFTSVAHATLMANTAPIFVSLAGLMFLGHKIKSSFFMILCLAMFGVFLVILSGSGQDDSRLFGDALGILAALFYAGYILSMKSLTNKFSPAQALFFATVFTAIFLLPISFYEADKLLPPNADQWTLLIGYALISQTLAQGLITYGISKVTAHLSSLILLIQPVAAAIYGWLLLSEALSSMQIIGGFIVLVSIYLASSNRD